MILRLVAIAVFLTLIQFVQAQSNNERCKWIKDFDTPIILDSLSVVPESLSSYDIKSQNISDGTVVFNKHQGQDSLQVCYQVFPISFHHKYQNRSLSVYDSNAFFKDPVKENNTLKREELFTTEGLYKSGSISRGISFGNNQDVFVNSALNLNMDGKLTDDVFIRAAITDQNVPYQPEGNTQQLQDFDNVFIQVYNDNFSVTGGDVVFKNGESNFLRYYKNVQGGKVDLNYGIGSSTATTSAGFSVAKGKFASVLLEAVEGLSGPYRIPGPEAQRFLLILANSERVFIDGQQLTRGFDNDYVIDYNSGEITFTNKVLITQFTRIRVDYEYSDQNYSRSISTANYEQTIGNLKIGVSAYSEKDNENRPLLFDLTDDDKLYLSTIGDSLELAQTSTIDSVGYSQDLILYRKIVVTDNDGNHQEIYQYSTNPDSAVYRLSFSEVGFGNGDYELFQGNTNGRVYRWVSPVNGTRQGRFSPVATLATPNKKQMVTVQASYALTEHEELYSEVAFSDRDVNLYSDIDNSDNKGFAIKSGVRSEGRPVNFLTDYKLKAYADFEVDDKNFTAIDRFRYIEFDRDWNFDPNTDKRKVEDKIVNAGVAVEKDQNNLFQYDLTHRLRGPQVNGFQHRVKADYRLGILQWRTSYFDMSNDMENQAASWKRYSADFSINQKHIIPGYRYSADHNMISEVETDSVKFSSMYYDEHSIYLRNGADADVDFELRHSLREDKSPQNGEIDDYSYSETTTLNFNKAFDSQSINGVFIYRSLDIKVVDETWETVAGRIDWIVHLFQNHIKSELTYSIANSQELKREFVYIKVPTGEGTHTWRDLNNDGVQELGEFFEAINVDERNYAKIFTPSTEFVTAYQNLFIYRINIEAPRNWRQGSGIKKFVSKFSNNTSWSSDKKITDDDLSKRLLAFAEDVDQTEVLSDRTALRSTMFFNRANPVYGLEFTYFDNSQKQFLSNGFESRANKEYSSNLRFNIARQYSINLFLKKGNKEVSSDFLTDRNYLIEVYQLSPQVSWQPSNSFRFTLQYRHTEKNNILTTESAESALSDEILGEVRLNKAIKSNFSAQLRYINIAFEGEENSSIGYDLLDALRPGTNVTWMVNWQQKITNGLQLNLSYNGRKSEANDPVHVGRVQVSALF